ncbi:hypothetical protein B9479_004637 [Cryptococcus floricola]|uniref:Uncharacterized protein n=1 Tax=Cryptococcus floricola TaxID=2591691 RepID=A0A5D3AVB8_9TREE|nr:hypothetical protein B9479_004637 [Cryptococcus floricola]
MGDQGKSSQVDDSRPEADSEEALAKPRYAPPRKPLSPYQLRRIAGTFGIAIPSLDLPPPSPASASSSNPMSTPGPSRTGGHSPLLSPYSPHGYTSTRPSPYLLSVIPPVTLLPPTSALTPEQARKREKKWRRGTLMPLQPTLGGMLLCIAREYGLPSTTGLNVYLVLPQSAPFSQRSTGGDDSDEEPDGPRVSSQTWTTLFSSYLLQSSAAGSISRASTPFQTPIKSASESEGSDNRPSSPLARHAVGTLPLGTKHQSTLSTSTSASHLSANSHSKDSSLSSIVPPTPMSSVSAASTQHPIVGTIEFDVDSDEAAWFEDWKLRGGKRRWMKAVNGDNEGEGVRELGLVRKMEESGGVKPRFLRDIEAERLAQEAHEAEERAKDEQVSEVVKLLGDQGVSREDLLKSPIQLGWRDGGEGGASQAVKRVQEVLEKRWSGLVMSDQLDDLERIMRGLSPKEIRVTSPRYMTPGTAARMANNSTLTPLPSVPERVPLSPLNEQLQTPNFDISDNEYSGSDYGEGESMEESAQRHSTAPTNKENSYVVEDPIDMDQQQAWPAQSYRTPTLPNSPTAVQHFHRPSFPTPEQASSPGAGPSRQLDATSPVAVSSETMSRMQADEPKKAATPDWVPRRPARPPSPQLPDQSTLNHTLSSGYVDILRSPPPSVSPTGKTFIGSPKFGLGLASPEASTSGLYEDGRRKKGGPLKGLRHQMSGVNLGIKWKQDGKDASPGQSSTSGLASSPNEFGALAEHEEDDGRHNSLPGRVNPAKLSSRIFPASFGFRKNDESRPASLPHRRNPSHDGPINISEISGPIMSSFRHTRSGSLASNMPESTALPQHTRTDSKDMQSPVQPFVSQTPTTPASPASPTRSVRRKPVPSMQNGQQSASSDSVGVGISLRGQEESVKSSMSLGSVASFVLEDPPRGKKGLGMAV